MTQDTKKFTKMAKAEDGQSVTVVGSTLIASAVGAHAKVSARTILAIIRGTTKLDADTKRALAQSLEEIDANTELNEKDRRDALDTIDTLREELSEPAANAKRVRRFLNNLTDISEPAAKFVRECPRMQEILPA